jgi:macrolide-specific efflux system membrane fusion protein
MGESSKKGRVGEMGQARWKKAFFLVLALVLAIAGVFFLRRGTTPLAISYREALVVRSPLEITIQSTGVVQPENRLEIKPPIPGRIESVVGREGQWVRKGDILAWMSSTERAAMIDAARAKGPEELSRWEELYRPTPILAPISGTIILRNVEAGQTFSGTDSVFVMSDRLTVTAQVDETDIAQISLGQRATVTLDAYPARPIGGKVGKIAFDAKTVNNVTTYEVDVQPAETPREMRSGMTASVLFRIADRTDALVVPSEGVKVRGSQRYVLVPSPEGKDPAERIIETGVSDGKLTEVLSGLREGDKLLIAELKSQASAAQPGSPFSPMGRGRPGGRGGH